MAFPTDKELLTAIENILQNADLDHITSRKVRRSLEDHFSVELSMCKDKLEKMIMTTISKQISARSKKSTADDSSSEIPKCDSSDCDSSSSDEPEVPKKRKKRTGDEELARSLHAETNGMRRRSVSGKLKLITHTVFVGTKPKIEKRQSSGGKNGFTRPLTLSDEMAVYLGEKQLSRAELVKRLWACAREQNLFDPENKQYVICNEDWQRLFGQKRFRMFGIAKHLRRHIVD
ncbi:Upstream activation factor subunit UAF30 [Paragonimus heterotremus]|uniref:Upstream activation factor subunit UAF30 n=1 Tax=Paragonimus heterotremus TaxID=100268 RepID=A0A8J4WH45_9TREM|nr:Upstream activation factor subunit UAF30 [Paragonimus heterotremus]